MLVFLGEVVVGNAVGSETEPLFQLPLFVLTSSDSDPQL